MRKDNSYSIVKAISINHYTVCNGSSKDRSWCGVTKVASRMGCHSKPVHSVAEDRASVYFGNCVLLNIFGELRLMQSRTAAVGGCYLSW